MEKIVEIIETALGIILGLIIVVPWLLIPILAVMWLGKAVLGG